MVTKVKGSVISADGISYTPAGTGAVTTNVQDKLREFVSYNDFPTLQEACDHAASVGLPLRLAGNNITLTSTLVLTSSHSELTIDLDGGSIIKGFNGTLITATNTIGFDIIGTGVIDGASATYTGKGIIYSGTCNYPTIAKTVTLLNFDSVPLEFGANAGFRCKINPVIRFDSGTPVGISCTGPDTTAMFRDFSGVSCNGSISLVGTQDTTINNAFVTKIDIDTTASITTVIGTIWGNSGGAVTIDGAVTQIIGCRLSAVVTLSSTMTGCFIGNTQTSPGYTNNAIPGNAMVIHHDLGQVYEEYFKHKIQLNPVGEIIPVHFTTVSNADYTWSIANGSASIIRYAATLTANRTITLNTATTRIFTKVKIYRGAGAFNLIIGSTGVSLAANEWCEVLFNGSAWEVIAKGSRI